MGDKYGFKSAFFLGFMVFLLFSLISCGKGKKKTEAVRKFTFYSSDLTSYQPFTDLIAQEMTRQSGVFLETQYSQSVDELSVMIANDHYPDFIYAKSDLSRLIEVGAIIPLDKYIEEYGQNMKALYGDQLVKLKYSLDDPHIYSMGTFDVKNRLLEVGGNIQLQHAVLKELGYPKINTLEDLENALLAYKSKYPYINGNETIGFSLLCDDWFWYLGLSNPGGYLIGKPDDGQWFVDQNTLKAEYKFLNAEMPVFYKWLNKIYHEGLLDIESFTQKEDVFQAKLSSGRVLATSYPHWGLQDSRNSLIQNGMDDRVFAYLPVTAGSEYKDQALKDYGFSGGWGIAISKSCTDPVAAFKFLDYLCAEDTQILLNWGIEGITYTYDSYGKRVELDNIPENSGLGLWAYPFPQAGKGAFDSKGDTICKLSEEKLKKSYIQTEKDTLAAYGAEMWTDLFPSSEELGVSRHGQVWQYSLSSDGFEKLNKIDAYVKNCLIKMILSESKDFDSAWKEMVAGIRSMEIDSVTEELNDLISQKMTLWGN